PAHQCQLISYLVKGRPDVIEELNLHDGLQPSRSHANGASHYVGLCERRVEDACSAELSLQIGSDFEDAALTLHTLKIFFARAIGNVLAKYHYSRIALHLF